MKNLSFVAKLYILGTILIGSLLFVWSAGEADWLKPGLLVLAALGAVAQTLKVEGPDSRTNYSIAWFVYGFTFMAFGPASAFVVVLLSHIVEWIWHKYPWYIQTFNLAAHGVPLLLGGLLFGPFTLGPAGLDLTETVRLVAANLLFVFGNHLLVGLVVKLARDENFAQSGVFGFLTLFLDFTMLSMGAVTALVWQYSPFATVMNILPLYLLYHALWVPALKRQVQELKSLNPRVSLQGSGD